MQILRFANCIVVRIGRVELVAYNPFDNDAGMQWGPWRTECGCKGLDLGPLQVCALCHDRDERGDVS